MQTIDTSHPVSGAFEISGAFEPCGSLVVPGDGSPVCAACGWLDAEHEPPRDDSVAEVRALPARPSKRPAPKRLAS